MNRQQTLLVSASVLLAILFYFGFRIVPESHSLLEKSRAMNVETVSIESLKQRAIQGLNTEQKNYIASLENIIRLTDNDSVKVATMKQLSGAWFDFSSPALAGYWAREVASNEKTAEAWSIAGSTFASALGGSIEAEIMDYCFNQAVQCFENAISLEPENPDHRINLAICYAEHPVNDDPMKGIRSLLSLVEQYPDHPGVRYHLARFAVQTGQTERAIQRLNEALEIDPGYIRAHCLLANVLDGTDQEANAVKHRVICEQGLINE